MWRLFRRAVSPAIAARKRSRNKEGREAMTEVLNVDATHDLVLGWAIICKQDDK
jgi:hypothetical protein